MPSETGKTVLTRRRWLAGAAALTLSLGVLSACGSSDSSSGNASGGSGSTKFSGEKSGSGKRGGTLTLISAGDVDYADPGLTYYTFGYMLQYAVNRTLYSYGPGDTGQPRPDLAEGKPEISADNKTVTVHLRPGVRYAPPVNREVKAADIKYAFERSFSKNVPSSYATVYFKDIAGAPSSPGAIKDIPGIETPDDRTIVFKLKSATAPTLAQALAMPISTPVPREYAGRYDAKVPSTYDQHVAFTGPYMYKNDKQGRLVGRQPGKSIDLVRNPNWDPRTDYRPAYLDAIHVQEGNTDAVTSLRRVLNGSHMAQGDGTTPAPLVKQAISHNKGQLALIPGGGYRFIAFNETIKPLDNINIRKALIANSDRAALTKTRGGSFIGDVATHFLPPSFPGFDEAGGMKGTGVDFLAKPDGDPAVAKKYMLAAKKQDPSLPIDAGGKWTGSDQLLLIATNADPGKKTAEVALGQFQRLGFKIKFRIVPQDTLYTKFCNVPSAKVAICTNVGFFKDFNDPQAMLDPVFNGENILPAGNSNWSQMDDKALNAEMDRAKSIPVGPARNKAWGQLDAKITEQAPGIPWIWDKVPTVESRDVRGVVNEYQTSWDLNFTSLR